MAVALTTAPASAADDRADVDEIADVIAEAAPTGEPVATVTTLSHTEATFDRGAADISLALDADRPVSIEADDFTLGISLPQGLNIKDGVVARDGTVVFAANGDDAHAAVQSLEDGSVRLQTVLDSHEAPSTYTYDFGHDVELVLLEDGSVEVAENLGDGVTTVLGTVDAPWAVDANGAEVPTHYAVDGGNLTQHVAHSSEHAYPVTADPTYSVGWWRYVHFNKAETRTIANGGWGAAAISAACAKAHWAAGAACLAQLGSIVYVAGTGVNSTPMKCLVLKFSHTGGLATIPGTYRDSRCK